MQFYLVCLDILHSEVKPDTEPGVACVRANKEIILKFCYVVNSAKVAWNALVQLE